MQRSPERLYGERPAHRGGNRRFAPILPLCYAVAYLDRVNDLQMLGDLGFGDTI